MFWDKVAGIYDLFGAVYNGKVNRAVCMEVAAFIEPGDRVLECGCGTGLLSACIAPKCRELLATDLSEKMLRQTQKKCSASLNITYCLANIMHLEYPEQAFDKVVAANVLHLLEDPYHALRELDRVCCLGGALIIPTYVNKDQSRKISLFAKSTSKAGAEFKSQFSYESYQTFFFQAGYTNVSYKLVEGRVPCAVAVITKEG